MAKARCLIPSSEFVYAVINGIVNVESNKELPLMKWGGGAAAEGRVAGRDPIFSCVDGNLRGLDIHTALFTAPRAGLYNVTFLCKYKVTTFMRDAALTGNTNTKIATVQRIVDPQFVNPVGSTNSFSKFKGKYVSACAISAVIPLVEGEVMAISLYQNNNLNHLATVEAELVIMYDSSYESAIDSEIYKDSVRCPGFEGPQGDLELKVPDENFLRYAQAPQNRFKPFDRIEITDILGKTSTIFPSYFEKIRVIDSERWQVKTDNEKMLDEADILNVRFLKNGRVVPSFGYNEVKIFYKDGELEESEVDADLTVTQTNKIKEKERKDFLKSIVEGDEDRVNELLDRGIVRYVDTDQGKTPLETAIEAKNLDMVKLLLEVGASIDGDILRLARSLDKEIYEYLSDRAGYQPRFTSFG